jgi:hypothetical protein
MRVKIGPYRDWIGPYQIADAIFFWIKKNPDLIGDEKLIGRWDYSAAFKLGHWLNKTWVYRFCDWIDKKKKRKIKVRIDPYDTWAMDHTLAYIIAPMLRQLKDTMHGSHSVNDEDVPEEIRSTSAPPLTQDQKDNGYTDDFFEQRWIWVLDEMIWTFECLQDEYDMWDQLIDEDGTYDLAKREELEKRIANGLRLFGKYYRCLWD